MKPPERDEDYLADACRAVRTAMRFAEEHTMQSFCEDGKTRAAVERMLSIVGEALGRTSDSYRSRHPDVPWQRLIRLRHKLSHEYGAPLAELVWEEVRNDLPRVQPLLEAALPHDLRHTLHEEPGYRAGAGAPLTRARNPGGS